MIICNIMFDKLWTSQSSKYQLFGHDILFLFRLQAPPWCHKARNLRRGLDYANGLCHRHTHIEEFNGPSPANRSSFHISAYIWLVVLESQESGAASRPKLLHEMPLICCSVWAATCRFNNNTTCWLVILYPESSDMHSTHSFEYVSLGIGYLTRRWTGTPSVLPEGPLGTPPYPRKPRQYSIPPSHVQNW